MSVVAISTMQTEVVARTRPKPIPLKNLATEIVFSLLIDNEKDDYERKPQEEEKEGKKICLILTKKHDETLMMMSGKIENDDNAQGKSQ